MSRTVHDAKLETRQARLKLTVRSEPYWRAITEGCHLGYYKGARGGNWIARHRSLQGGYLKRRLGAADDVADGDGVAFLSYKQAQDAALAWFTGAGDSSPGGPYVVATALDDYLADYRRRGGKALRTTEISVDAFIRPRLGETPIGELTAKIIRGWHAHLAEASPRLRTRKAAGKQNVREVDAGDPDATRRRRATANRVLTVLKAALNHAFQEGKIGSDEAWRRVKPFREADAAKVRYLDSAEAQRLVSAADPAFRPLVQAALLTGCRYGEITAFRVADFDRVAGTVMVRSAKSGKPRHVVLTEDGIGLFEAHIADKLSAALVFARPDGKAWGKSHQHRPLREACEGAKIEPAASFHVLRHTYATMLLRAGAPLPVIAANLGHADTRMTERHYAHLAPSYVADVIRATMPSLGLVSGNTSGLVRSRTPNQHPSSDPPPTEPRGAANGDIAT
jgi:integrase